VRLGVRDRLGGDGAAREPEGDLRVGGVDRLGIVEILLVEYYNLEPNLMAGSNHQIHELT
jgi:hypothetical protein